MRRLVNVSLARRAPALCGGAMMRVMAPQTRLVPSNPTFLSARCFSGGTPSPFILADIGEGIAEVEILQWFKKEGDSIEEFDPICEVQSDKATVTISSPFEGVITKLYYEAGDIAKTGAPLIDVMKDGAADGEDAAPPVDPSEPAAASEPAPAAAPAAAAPAAPSGGKVLASPAVRRLAKNKGVDLSQVSPTGRGGRILKGDVLQAESTGGATPLPSFARSPSAASMPPAAAAPAARPAAAPAPSSPAAPVAPPVLPPRQITPGQSETEVLKGVRKAMVKSMTPAADVPWFGYSDDVEMDGLMEVRASMKASLAESGIKLTYMPFLLKALAVALQQYPILNSSLSSDLNELVWHSDVNLGVAMDTPKGLVVPNIKQVSNLSLVEIAMELQRLQGLALAGKLGPEDLTGGTFTLSNIGNVGGTILSPVPMPGESAIGAVGRTKLVPRCNAKGDIVARHVMQVSWRADHRVVDGATLARFSEAWREMVESPVSMIKWLR